MSSTHNESNKVYYITLVKENPPEGKTTAVVAVLRGKSKQNATTATAVTSTTKSK
jgi:hypothetical protein